MNNSWKHHQKKPTYNFAFITLEAQHCCFLANFIWTLVPINIFQNRNAIFPPGTISHFPQTCTFCSLHEGGSSIRRTGTCNIWTKTVLLLLSVIKAYLPGTKLHSTFRYVIANLPPSNCPNHSHWGVLFPPKTQVAATASLHSRSCRK